MNHYFSCSADRSSFKVVEPATADQVVETAHLLGSNPQLTGILSQPDPASDNGRKTAVVILSSGLLHRVGPFRLHVDLARCLSMAGYFVLRLDQAGRGDSSRSRGLSLAETIQEELDTVAEFLHKSCGKDKLVLIGLCSGADDALELASSNNNIVGLVLLDGYARTTARYYFHYYLRRMISPRRVFGAIARRVRKLGKQVDSTPTRTEVVVGDLESIRNFPRPDVAASSVTSVVGRGGSVLNVFTGGVEDYYSYEGQLKACLGGTDYGKAFKEVYFPNAKHTYPIHNHRKSLVCLVTEWCCDRVS